MNTQLLGNHRIAKRGISRLIVILCCLPIFLTFCTLLPPSLATGEHLGSEGQVHSQECGAYGKVKDLDDSKRTLKVQILADGNLVKEVPADFFCEGSLCTFLTGLWGLMTPNDYHEIRVQVYDEETEQWIDLDGTPKSLSCVNYDIYTIDIETGKVERITFWEELGEYNPSWSPDGKYVVYNVFGWWEPDELEGYLYITNLDTLEAVQVPNSKGGEAASWSPNGQWIAFQQNNNLLLVSPSGGTPELIISNAVYADWAPDSQRLVYQKSSDGSLHTATIKGGDKTLLVPLGNRPNWSPNGQWIAYALDGDLWKVEVDTQGVPQGDPIQLTSGPALDDHPSWSNNSETIVFHSDAGGDFDLWTISAAGGEPTLLTGVPEIGEWDSDFSSNGRFVAWSRPQIP